MRIDNSVREYLKRYGAGLVTTWITAICVSLSCVFVWLLNVAQRGWGHEFVATEYLIPVLVPLMVAPPGAYITLRLLEQLIATEERNQHLVSDLKHALGSVKTLSGLLPICAHCKDIRDDEGYWHQIEAYISDNSNADFTHGLCPTCAKELYPQ